MAIIPKPLLAEANNIMKILSDDDQAFMRRSLLIGIGRSWGISNSPNVLLRLAEGKGHSFTDKVHLHSMWTVLNQIYHINRRRQ